MRNIQFELTKVLIIFAIQSGLFIVAELSLPGLKYHPVYCRSYISISKKEKRGNVDVLLFKAALGCYKFFEAIIC